MSAAIGKGTPQPSTLLVMVVDDDYDARRIYSEYMRSQGLQVTTAADGRKGIQKPPISSPT